MLPVGWAAGYDETVGAGSSMSRWEGSVDVVGHDNTTALLLSGGVCALNSIMVLRRPSLKTCSLKGVLQLQRNLPSLSMTETLDKEGVRIRIEDVVEWRLT